MARVKLIVNKEDIAPEHHALFDKLAALRGRISGPSTVVLHSPGLARAVGARPPGPFRGDEDRPRRPRLTAESAPVDRI